VKRLHHLEQENAKLKKLVAERVIEIDVTKEIAAKEMVSAGARRSEVVYAQRRGVSVRKACAVVGGAIDTWYESRVTKPDAPR
jgi:hypothetical protein